MQEKSKGRPVTTPGGANLVAKLRREFGLNQFDAAALLGVTRNNISILERSDKIPNGIATLVALHLALRQMLTPAQAAKLLALAEEIKNDHK